MTDKLKSFLGELAELMKRYEADFNITESSSGWESYPKGLEISINTPYEEVEIDSRWINYEDIQNAIK